jgi:hypothetical protein
MGGEHSAMPAGRPTAHHGADLLQEHVALPVQLGDLTLDRGELTLPRAPELLHQGVCLLAKCGQPTR